eukprot:gene11364-32584_t
MARRDSGTPNYLSGTTFKFANNAGSDNDNPAGLGMFRRASLEEAALLSHLASSSFNKAALPAHLHQPHRLEYYANSGGNGTGNGNGNTRLAVLPEVKRESDFMDTATNNHTAAFPSTRSITRTAAHASPSAITSCSSSASLAPAAAVERLDSAAQPMAIVTTEALPILQGLFGFAKSNRAQTAARRHAPTASAAAAAPPRGSCNAASQVRPVASAATATLLEAAAQRLSVGIPTDATAAATLIAAAAAAAAAAVRSPLKTREHPLSTAGGGAQASSRAVPAGKGDRVKVKKEGNRVAAKRCRDKKKGYIANLKVKAACLEAYNNLLLKELVRAQQRAAAACSRAGRAGGRGREGVGHHQAFSASTTGARVKIEHGADFATEKAASG